MLPEKTFQPQAPSIAFLSSSFHHTFVRFYHGQRVRQKPRKQAVSTKLQMPGPTPNSHRWPAEQHVGCLRSFQRPFLKSSQKIGFLIRSHPPQCLQKHCCHLPPQSALAHRPSCSAAAAACGDPVGRAQQHGIPHPSEESDLERQPSPAR